MKRIGYFTKIVATATVLGLASGFLWLKMSPWLQDSGGFVLWIVQPIVPPLLISLAISYYKKPYHTKREIGGLLFWLLCFLSHFIPLVIWGIWLSTRNLVDIAYIGNN